MIYLATPYSHPDPDVREWRYQQACVLWRAYMAEQQAVFAPVVHAHPTAIRYGLPTDHEFWLAWDHAILARCDELWIAELPGWEQSRGIDEERKYAKTMDIAEVIKGDARMIVAAAGLATWPPCGRS